MSIEQYRAMFYLDMARLYEFKENGYTEVSDNVLGLTVPIVTEETTEEQSMNNPRAPREKMYAFILDDLSKAEEYLEGQTVSLTRPSVPAVNGLYARA